MTVGRALRGVSRQGAAPSIWLDALMSCTQFLPASQRSSLDSSHGSTVTCNWS